jgi:tetratricopeptide (TPR) repeat protein
MSIIHEALKKAEREREPVLPKMLSYGANGATSRRWTGVVMASLLLGVTTVGGFAAWAWWRGLSSPSMVHLGTPEPADDTPPHGFGRGSTDGTGGPEGASRSPRHEASTSPAPEADQNAESAFAKAREAEASGQWEEAIRHYRQAIALNPLSLEARNNLGNLFIHRRQIAAAIVELRAALAIDANYVIARNNLGSAYLLNGEEGRAVQEFLAAVHIDGTYVSPYYNLALLYARRGDVDQSMAFLTRALAIEPAVLSWVQDEPDFDSVRGASAFQRLRVQNQARR